MIRKELNTKQVSNLFGVDESTVRRWSLAGKINSSSSAGGHRNFSYKNIIEFAKNKGIELNLINKNQVFDRKKITKDLFNYSLKKNSQSIEITLIKLYLNGIQLHDLMDNYIEGALVKLQRRLDLKKISVAEEHIARKIISKSLNTFKLSISNNKASTNENILCLNLENDIPDLPIDMIQILLEHINYNVDNCGSHTSIENLKILLSNKKYKAIFIYMCDRQCCTSTVHDNIKKTNSDLKEISRLADKYKIQLFLGGPSFKNINKQNLKNCTTFTKYSETLKIIKP